MSGTAPGEVLAGRVREWHSEEGWGVLVTDALSAPVWAHFSAIEADGYRELTAGQHITFTAEEAQQDEYSRRAVNIWPDGVSRHRPQREDGPGYNSRLNITFDS